MVPGWLSRLVMKRGRNMAGCFENCDEHGVFYGILWLIMVYYGFKVQGGVKKHPRMVDVPASHI
jgi:hypothetical protein